MNVAGCIPALLPRCPARVQQPHGCRAPFFCLPRVALSCPPFSGPSCRSPQCGLCCAPQVGLPRPQPGDAALPARGCSGATGLGSSAARPSAAAVPRACAVPAGWRRGGGARGGASAWRASAGGGSRGRGQLPSRPGHGGGAVRHRVPTAARGECCGGDAQRRYAGTALPRGLLWKRDRVFRAFKGERRFRCTIVCRTLGGCQSLLRSFQRSGRCLPALSSPAGVQQAVEWLLDNEGSPALDQPSPFLAASTSASGNPSSSGSGSSAYGAAQSPTGAAAGSSFANPLLAGLRQQQQQQAAPAAPQRPTQPAQSSSGGLYSTGSGGTPAVLQAAPLRGGGVTAILQRVQDQVDATET